MHRLTLLPLLLLASNAASAAADYKPNFTATLQVSKYLLSKDCPGAVKELNKALKDNTPEILILAGSLFEEGVCVKQNMEQAAQYYMRADEAKHPRAMDRMIAMYAKDNRDVASALWWANKARRQMPAVCQVAPQDASDPDTFVAALNKWPKGQLGACVYTIGVYSRILGLAEFPDSALLKGSFGTVRMQFVPAEGKVSWIKEEGGILPPSGVVGAGETERWAFRNSIMPYLEGLGERTLKEFPKPAGIHPAWRLEAQFRFDFL